VGEGVEGNMKKEKFESVKKKQEGDSKMGK
jgi:hypothetical protein